MALLRPLRERDFALLWLATFVSLLGDGIYLVAIAWAAYDISNEPAALAAVGFAWATGMLAFLLVGGVVSDRAERRRVMIWADAVRLLAAVAAGTLALAGALELWHLIALALVFGAGEAFFGPAMGALVPRLVPSGLLVQANALHHLARPLAMRALGPALGGLIVAKMGAGAAFLIDGATFAASIACIVAIRARPGIAPGQGSMLDEVRTGLVYVRSQTWIWATLVAAAIALLVFWGPLEVLTPYLVRNDLDAGAGTFGLVLAANGVGSVAGSLLRGHRGMPRRPVSSMLFWWGIGTFPLAGFAFATQPWHLMVMSFTIGATMGYGIVVWTTLLQTRVPEALLGRVTSVDWFVSVGLLPVSFALTAPAAAWLGIDGTFIAAGVIGAGSTLAILYLVPGLRERRDVVEEAGIGDGGGLHPVDLDPLLRGQPGDGAEHREPVVPVRGDPPAA